MQRILIIRFSSIGDIVLTSPVARLLRSNFPDSDIRFVTKKAFMPLVEHDPRLNGFFTLGGGGIAQLIRELRAFGPDLVIDLHHNLRTSLLKAVVGGRWLRLNKLNVEKWLMTRFKLDLLPNTHVVDRYVETLQPLGIENDRLGLDLFLPAGLPCPELPAAFKGGFVALVIGAKFSTKQLPEEKLVELCDRIKQPVILIGGSEDVPLAAHVMQHSTGLIHDRCGKLSLLESARLIKESLGVVTHDTGMMHIAAAFRRPIVSIWGNTVPDFGMYPYLPQGEPFAMMEVEELSCRPCSKIGYDRCPKSHFRCMTEQDTDRIVEQLTKFIE